MWQIPSAMVTHSQGLATMGHWRYLKVQGRNHESAEGTEGSCNQAHLLRKALKAVSPAFPVPSALGSHLNYYKVTVKRKHSNLDYVSDIMYYIEVQSSRESCS